MKLSYLWRGLPGHPVHPPLTDATIGAYTFATVAAFIQVVGITSHAGAYGWWLALVMATASVFFVLAIIVGHKHYTRGLVGTWPFIFTVIGFGVMTVGGWLGGAIVFVHGMRVLNLVDEPALKASAPVVTPEKEQAEGA